MALDRNAILAHTGVFEHREVHVPAWADASGDDVVLVRGMTSKEWDTHQARVLRNREAGKDQSNATADLVVRCVVNADGSRVFEAKDAPMVGELPLTELNKIGQAILELSGIVDGEEEEIDANLGQRPTDSSSSSSPPTSSTSRSENSATD